MVQRAGDYPPYVLTVIAKVSSDGRIFTTDHLLPISDPTDDTPIPNYQAYVCLSWMKQVGLLDQHGRRGYTAPHSVNFDQVVDSFWQTVPTERRGDEQ